MVTAQSGGGATTAEATDYVEVAARPLADLVPDATVVKLDVEGHEYAILPGALETMPHVKAWLLELHGVADHPLEETLSRLVDRGYALMAAGTSRSNPDGPWVNVAIDPSLTWDAIPGTRTIRDGMPNLFKMLHVIAKKE
jgi:hypothetical protein